MPNGLSNVTKLESSRFVAVNLLTFPLRCKSFRFIKGTVNGDLTGDSFIFLYFPPPTEFLNFSFNMTEQVRSCQRKGSKIRSTVMYKRE